MIKIESKGFENSLVESNVEGDLYCNNYLAFARYIAGIECDGEITFPTFTQCCSAYSINDRTNLSDKNTKKVKKSVKVKKNTNNVFRVTNIITNETYDCQCNQQVSEITGMNRTNVSVYCRSGAVYKKTFLVKRLTEFNHNYKNKPLLLIHTKTFEVLECDSVKEAAKFLGVKRGTIDYYIRKGKYKDYEIQYKNEGDKNE